MKRRSLSIFKTCAKWLIAVVGIYIIAQFITIRDQVMVVRISGKASITPATSLRPYGASFVATAV